MPPGRLNPKNRMSGGQDGEASDRRMSDMDALLNDSGYRRRWLLTKALEEGVPLADALRLAQAAEKFLTGLESEIALPDWVNRPEAARQRDQQQEITTTPNAIEASDALSSVVSIDEVVRYLGQSGEVVVPEAGDKFLVGGCFTESIEQLLIRANRIRTQQRLPPFACLPHVDSDNAVDRVKPGLTEKMALRRPPSARERAEWAQQVMALPA
jgi:hypothetical protein